MKSKRYNSSYLNEILFKIEFSPILQLYGEENSAKEFQEKIYKKFPNVKIVQQSTLKISPFNGQYTDKKDHLTWVFSNQDKQVELNATSLTLQYNGNAYSGYAEFKNDIALLLDSLQEYPIISVNFLGLRYINQITFDRNENFKEYINDNLHSNTNEFENETVLQSLSKTDIKIDNYLLSFQYGQFNPEYPNKNPNKDFILDLDCYINETEEFSKIIENLDEMHNIIEKYFEKSIKDKLRQKMGVENE